MASESTPLFAKANHRRRLQMSLRDTIILEEDGGEEDSSRNMHTTPFASHNQSMAPRGKLPSLDFDRVVNSYSIMATKKRLRKRHLLVPATATANEEKEESIKPTPQRRRQTLRRASAHYHYVQRSQYDGRQIVSWILTLSTGLLCGLIAVLILYCVESIVFFRITLLNQALKVIENPETAEQFQPQTFLERVNFWIFGRVDRYMTVQHKLPGLYIVFCTYNLMLACPSCLLCLWLAPAAIGSGIPEVKAYLNGVCVPSFADFNTLCVKIVGTILSVSSGLIVGPEGPLVSIGAIVGQGLTKSTRLDIALQKLQANFPCLTQWCGCACVDAFGDGCVESLGAENGRNQLPREIYDLQEELRAVISEEDEEPESINLLDGKTTDGDSKIRCCQGEICCGCRRPRNSLFSRFVSVLSRFRNDCDRRDGAATGFAAAFGAPVGSILYSMEEASSFFTIPLMWRMLAATAVGTLVIAVYHGDLAKFSVLELGEAVSENKFPTSKFYEVPLYVFVGACGGLLGAFFNACFTRMNLRRMRLYSRMSIAWQENLVKLAEVATISLITSTIIFLLPILMPKSWVCRHVQLSASSESVHFFDRFTCDENSVNAFAVVLLGSRGMYSKL